MERLDVKTFLAGLVGLLSLAFCAPGALAQGQPASWSYSFDANNNAEAIYPGNATIVGLLSVGSLSIGAGGSGIQLNDQYGYPLLYPTQPVFQLPPPSQYTCTGPASATGTWTCTGDNPHFTTERELDIDVTSVATNATLQVQESSSPSGPWTAVYCVQDTDAPLNFSSIKVVSLYVCYPRRLYVQIVTTSAGTGTPRAIVTGYAIPSPMSNGVVNGTNGAGNALGNPVGTGCQALTTADSSYLAAQGLGQYNACTAGGKGIGAEQAPVGMWQYYAANGNGLENTTSYVVLIPASTNYASFLKSCHIETNGPMPSTAELLVQDQANNLLRQYNLVSGQTYSFTETFSPPLHSSSVNSYIKANMNVAINNGIFISCEGYNGPLS
jgi:hypothetical protein